jgi:hypothetical protein
MYCICDPTCMYCLINKGQTSVKSNNVFKKSVFNYKSNHLAFFNPFQFCASKCQCNSNLKWMIVSLNKKDENAQLLCVNDFWLSCSLMKSSIDILCLTTLEVPFLPTQCIYIHCNVPVIMIELNKTDNWTGIRIGPCQLFSS